MQGGLIPAGLQASSRVAPSVIHIGDTVTVSVTAKPGEGVKAPTLPAKIGEFELLGVARAESADVARIHIHVTTFETGEKTLPSIAIPVTAAGRIDSLRTPEWRITVESLLPADTTALDTLTVREARAPIAIPQKFLWNVFFGYVLFLGALVGLAFLIHRRLTRKRPSVALPKAAAPVRAADVVALEALDEIRAKGYVARGLFKEHYTEVMDVLRGYIEGRFRVEALDRTTWELVQELERTPLPADQRAVMGRLLDEADLVKFAKYTPEAEAGNKVLDEARTWVRSTAAAPPAPPADAGLEEPPPGSGVGWDGTHPEISVTPGDRPPPPAEREEAR